MSTQSNVFPFHIFSLFIHLCLLSSFTFPAFALWLPPLLLFSCICSSPSRLLMQPKHSPNRFTAQTQPFFPYYSQSFLPFLYLCFYFSYFFLLSFYIFFFLSRFTSVHQHVILLPCFPYSFLYFLKNTCSFCLSLLLSQQNLLLIQQPHAKLKTSSPQRLNERHFLLHFIVCSFFSIYFYLFSAPLPDVILYSLTENASTKQTFTQSKNITRCSSLLVTRD